MNAPRSRDEHKRTFPASHPLERSRSYVTRVLCSTVGSLSLALGVAHLPINSGFDSIGWYVAPRYERVTVEMVDRAVEPLKDPGMPVTKVEEDEAPAHDDGQTPDEARLDMPSEGEIWNHPPLERMKGRRVYDFANRMPQIVGGTGAFYIHIEYPEEALLAGIEGRLVLSFIVETDGRTTEIDVIKSLHPACDSAAVAALRQTNFVPGEQNGQRIAVRMRLPVRFQLLNSRDVGTDSHAPVRGSNL